MYTNETVWIRTPLEETAVCLPIAEVELDCDIGHIITKAAVLRDSLDQGRYLLGNKTNCINDPNPKPTEEIIPEIYADNEDSSRELENILPLVEPEISKNIVKLSRKEFVEEQKKSAELKILFEEAKNGTFKKTNYIVEDNSLFFQKEDKDGTKHKLLVVPEKYRENLMTIGHEGQQLILVYLVGKPQDKNKAPLKIVPVITEIFTKINIDACGPLPMTPSGNRYIITALCMSSKYSDAIPVANLYSMTLVNALLQIFSRMGFPRELQTDQGTSFMSALTTEFLERFGVKVVRSPIYHPQSNPVERMHRTLKRILKVLCLDALPDWEKILPQALFALRIVIHGSTGFSSAELVHGKSLRTPVMLLYEKLTEEDPVESSVIEYVFELIKRMKKCQEVAVKNMENAKQKQKLWYDHKTVKLQFRPGELVLVVAQSRPTKLSVQWIGPGEIVQQLSETNYVVKFPRQR
ncbi:Retrovirus-related Pol polyprotein like [Argiope bruennichi]|uniref:Retrovirus-related Pol polyprotein like n=1 Tax=Argiope bruennichi TaxID=94029 RepID=A0A8T0E3M0_ARGBR|nr:Retrovirus-related Pol polyprotein like [Argiope bruennichi]